MDTHLVMLMEVDLKELRARRRPSIRLSTLMNQFLVVDGAEDVVEAKSVSLLMHYMAQFSQMLRFNETILQNYTNDMDMEMICLMSCDSCCMKSDLLQRLVARPHGIA